MRNSTACCSRKHTSPVPSCPSRSSPCLFHCHSHEHTSPIPRMQQMPMQSDMQHIEITNRTEKGRHSFLSPGCCRATLQCNIQASHCTTLLSRANGEPASQTFFSQPCRLPRDTLLLCPSSTQIHSCIYPSLLSQANREPTSQTFFSQPCWLTGRDAMLHCTTCCSTLHFLFHTVSRDNGEPSLLVFLPQSDRILCWFSFLSPVGCHKTLHFSIRALHKCNTQIPTSSRLKSLCPSS
jgi:hypothetical protein